MRSLRNRQNSPQTRWVQFDCRRINDIYRETASQQQNVQISREEWNVDEDQRNRTRTATEKNAEDDRQLSREIDNKSDESKTTSVQRLQDECVLVCAELKLRLANLADSGIVGDSDSVEIIFCRIKNFANS